MLPIDASKARPPVTLKVQHRRRDGGSRATVSVDLEHEPLHDLARRVIRLAEETQHAAQVLERRLEALERRSEAAGRAERILSIAADMRAHLGRDRLSVDDLYDAD